MKPQTLTLKISTNGTIRAIYDDSLVSLIASGHAKIARASNVEPGTDGKWYADMSPVSAGIVLGPFTLRKHALQAEVEYLTAHVL